MTPSAPDNLLWPGFRAPRVPDLVVDAVIAATLVFINITIGLSSRTTATDIDGVAGPEAAWEWALMLAPPIGLVLRRRFPLGSLGWVMAATAAVWGVGLPEFGVSITVALYSAVLFGRRPWNLRLPLVLGALLFLWTVLGWLSGSVEFYAVPVVGTLVAGAILAAATTATRHAYFAEVTRRMAQTERQRQADEEHVVTQERARIARELHDVVAHGLSLIVVQAGAARRVIDRDPDAARTALGEIEAAARSSLGEMRHVLGVLRSDEAQDRKPTPTLTALDQLFESYRRGGMAVTSECALDRPALPLTVDLGAYRIVEEALTNVFKHGGPGAEAHVRIDLSQGRLSVEVLDNGRGASAAPPTEGGGHGLRGMQERVEVLGGELRTGPRPGGGFEVRATIPVNVPGTAGVAAGAPVATDRAAS